MTENAGYIDDEQDEDPNPNWRRDLERRAREGDKAVKELQALKRREAIREAGLDPADKMVKLFEKAYDGDVTADAIKEAAEEYGLIKTEVVDEAAPPEQNPRQDGMDAITKAAGSPVSTTPDVKTDLQKAYQDGGTDGLLDQLEKLGIPVTTRQ